MNQILIPITVKVQITVYVFNLVLNSKQKDVLVEQFLQMFTKVKQSFLYGVCGTLKRPACAPKPTKAKKRAQTVLVCVQS